MAVSIADQTRDQLGGRASILARQRAEHIELDRLLRQVRRSTGEEQERILRRVYRLVFPHAFAEESVLWPAARRALPDGEALTLRIEDEHQDVNLLVTRLERSRPGDPGRAQLLEEVVELLQMDVRDEEDQLLPRLQETLSTRQLRRLGLAWEVVRRVSPTRPHPVVARRPPGNVLAALPLTVLDRARDAVETRTEQGPARVQQVGRALSSALASVAGAVERLPTSRAGEDPGTAARADGTG